MFPIPGRVLAALTTMLMLCTACGESPVATTHGDNWFETYQTDPAVMRNPMKPRLGPIDRSEPF